jgi:hypothetical protein
MSLNFKYALPLVQMAIAGGLLWWSHLWQRTAMRIMDIPGPAPAFTFLISLNAPVALARTLWYHYLPDLWEHVVFIAAIGAFWYWIALNIHSWRERRVLFLFTWPPLRITADLLLIAMGVFLGWICIMAGSGVPHVTPWLKRSAPATHLP